MKKISMFKIICFAALFVCLVLLLFLVPFLLKGMRTIQSEIRYGDAVGYFSKELEESLNHYYREKGRYPMDINLYDYSISKKNEYLKIAEGLRYSTDGNSFDIIWKYPMSLRHSGSFEIWTCKGDKGKRSYWNIEETNIEDVNENK